MPKTWVPLENNPQTMTDLAHSLGLVETSTFTDVLSLTDPMLLSLVPRPCHALLFTFPMTSTSEAFYDADESAQPTYNGSGPLNSTTEPVMFFHQTIRHACGMIGLLHCLTNLPTTSLPSSSLIPVSSTASPLSPFIKPNSLIATLIDESIALKPKERSQVLYDSDALERFHAHAAQQGDSIAPLAEEFDDPHAFVAFVKGRDGHLWELEGRRKGPVDRGMLGGDEDLLCEKALELGPGAYIRREMEGAKEPSGTGDVRFSCIALSCR